MALVTLAALLASPGHALAAGDFSLLLQPDSQQLPPGGAVAYSISIGSVGGFADPVSLAVGALPAGVTAILSQGVVTPPATVTLTLSADADAAIGVFDLTVTGTSGGLTHVANGSVTVDFGLVPVCYGYVEGIVSDAETGNPIEGATTINLEMTDAAGHWGPVEVTLGENNSPIEVGINATKAGYWDSGWTYETVICGQTTTFNQTLLKWQPAAIYGTVVEGAPDPGDPTNVIATGPTLDGANVSVSAYNIGASDTSGPDGAYRLDLPHLNAGNEPADVDLSASLEGYWPRGGGTPSSIGVGTVSPGDEVEQQIALVPICTGSISGTVTYGDTGQPAAGVSVQAAQTWDNQTVKTGADGTFAFPSVRLGYNDQPVDYGVASWADFYWNAGGTVSLSGCGAHAELSLTLPRVAVGSLEGYVTDEDTGDPVAGVQVGPVFGCAGCDLDLSTTDAAGHYRIDRMPADPPSTWSITTYHPDYWQSYGSVLVDADATARLDLVILKRKHADATGTVVDAVTGDPVEGAGVLISSGGATADSAGHYLTGPLDVGYRNEPIDVTASASASGYWPQSKPTTLVADQTSTVDFELLPICSGATIRGRVVDITTGQPIQGATVYATGAAQTATDGNGEYVLTNVPVGTNNSPNQVQVTATATGYWSQSRTVTVFCGASFTLDFGPPPPASALVGSVTDGVSGDPMAAVLVVGEWGGQTTTDASGNYGFDDVPLNADGSDRNWHVTAITDACGQQTKGFTAQANVTARVDFAFCGSGEQPAPGLSLDKSGVFDPGGDGIATPGDLVSWTLVVANTGNVDLHGVTVSDPLLGTVDCPGATIPVGGSMTCTGGYSVTQADIDAGTVQNSASADSDETEPTTATATVVLPQHPALTMTKSAATAFYSTLGQTIEYQFVVTNTGNVTLSGPVTIDDDRTTDETCPDLVTVGDLDADFDVGEMITCSATYTIGSADLAAGSVTNVATASALFGGVAVTSDPASATIRRLGGQILPTQTTCAMYRDGATSLTDAYYNVSKGKIGSVAPGVMFYYDAVTVAADSTPLVLSIAQSHDPVLSGWRPIPVQDVGQILLYDSDTCAKSGAQGQTAFDATTGTSTIQVTAPGTFIIGIKYSLSSLAGTPVGKPSPVVTYRFATNAEPASEAALAFSPKK